MHTDHFTYNQTDQLWPPPDTANSINCTTLLLLSGPASAALLSRLSDAGLPWTALATLWFCAAGVAGAAGTGATIAPGAGPGPAVTGQGPGTGGSGVGAKGTMS